MKKVIHEGKEIGRVAVNATPGVNIQVQSGEQDGNKLFKTYKVNSVTEDSINVTENPLLG
jgi:hypothetical protein